MPSRERPRPARRRIAGERTRPPGAAPEARRDEREDEVAAGAAPPEPAADAAPPGPAAPAQPAADTPDAATPTPGREAAPEGPVRDRAEETPPAPGPAGRPARPAPADDRGGPPGWVPAVLAGLLAVALALDAFVVWREFDEGQDEARALHSALIGAPSVAERAAESVLSFRHDTVDKDVAEARRFLTPDYAPAYISSIRDVVADPAGEVRATVEAQVLSSGVVEADTGRADVLLFVNQVTRSVGQPPRTALNRVVFTMVPRAGTWRVDEIRAF